MVYFKVATEIRPLRQAACSCREARCQSRHCQEVIHWDLPLTRHFPSVCFQACHRRTTMLLSAGSCREVPLQSCSSPCRQSLFSCPAPWLQLLSFLKRSLRCPLPSETARRTCS